MQIGLWALAGIGALVVIIVAIAACSFVWFVWKESKDRHEELARYDSNQRYLRDKLQSHSWWFSEDEPTMRLLQNLALGRNVSEIREQWRKERRGTAAGGEA
jgi:hypothetical protein